MSTTEIAGGNGAQVSVEVASVDILAAELKGELLRAGDPGYDDARTLWNAMIDKRPALIARCVGVADVQLAVNFAREHSLLTAIRSCGHNIAGNAVCEGGLMIDLSQMTTVNVAAAAGRVTIGPGITLGDLDKATQAHGLAVPVGINSTTGVAGLTLGGGFGWLSRRYGMTVDSLVSADVVTADGQLVHASETDHPDLFWAIRGGGGNFGVVTRFEFKCYPVGPEVLAGLVVYSLDEAKSVLAKYRKFAKTLSDDTSVWVVMRQAPPLPFLPEAVHGTDVVVFAACHCGDPAEGEKALAPLRKFGTVLGEHVGVQPFTAWQQAFDPLLTPGARNYWKSHNFIELSDETIDLAIKYTAALPSPLGEIFFGQLGGAVNRVAADATAYAHRDVNYVLNVHSRWDEAKDDAACIKWARDFFNATAPQATGGVYVNFMTEEETDRIGQAYGGGLGRLVKVKQKYDPSNLFRVNHNFGSSK